MQSLSFRNLSRNEKLSCEFNKKLNTSLLFKTLGGKLYVCNMKLTDLCRNALVSVAMCNMELTDLCCNALVSAARQVTSV